MIEDSPLEEMRRGLEEIASNTGVIEPQFIIPKWAQEKWGLGDVMTFGELNQRVREEWEQMSEEQRCRSREAMRKFYESIGVHLW